MLAPGNLPFTRSDFGYELPAEAIAQEPVSPREAARLLCCDVDGVLSELQVGDLPRLLPQGAVVVVNNTRVIAGRLLGHLASGGKVEIFLLGAPQGDEPAVMHCFGHPLRKLVAGKELLFAAGLQARVRQKIAVQDSEALPLLEIEFNCSGAALSAWLAEHGCIPLPPYIKRSEAPRGAQSLDSKRYQTVYAHSEGSVAAPTAGLHLSETVLAQLAAKQIAVVPVTLHVGAGTFLPVKSDDLSRHHMHREHYCVPAATLATLQAARRDQRPILLVGTTTLRCLEAFFHEAQGDETRMEKLCERWLSTNIFIYPKSRTARYRPWVGDALLTNFHQPCSTLYMLVCALFGYEQVAATYRFALQQGFRFLSYGDASLLAWKNLIR